MSLREIKLDRVPTVYVLMLAALALKLLNTMGVSQGDDLYYTDLAFKAAHGDLSADFQFATRWLVFLPTAALYRFYGVSDVTTLFFPVLFSTVTVYFAYKIVEFEINADVAVVATDREPMGLAVFKILRRFEVYELQRKLRLLPEVFFEECKVGIRRRVLVQKTPRLKLDRSRHNYYITLKKLKPG